MFENQINAFIDDATFNKILHYLSHEKGINISSFKLNYLKRRIYFRAIALKFSDIHGYWQYLITNEAEVNKFRDLLTVNVTSFFRNPDVFETLKRHVLPEIFREKLENREKFIKILSIGCATGEEPYSVAIILKEYFSEEIKTVKPYILGIDFDNQSIIQAQNAIYETQKIANVSEIIKKKYFAIIDYKHYKLDEEIRNFVIFRQDDIFLRDIKKFWDVVFCRNVMIYINTHSQEFLLNKIINATKAGSYLVLGKSEGLIGKLRTFYYPKYPKERIYVKRRVYES